MIAYTPLYFKFYRYPFVQYKEKSWYKILYQPLKQNYYFTNRQLFTKIENIL